MNGACKPGSQEAETVTVANTTSATQKTAADELEEETTVHGLPSRGRRSVGSGHGAPLTYRQDIDGLRGVAVAMIVLFHVWSSLIPGGFVGVDVFFVISGFLITQRLKRDVGDESFSFGHFYKLRIRRIFPAAAVCTAMIVCASAWLLMGAERTKALEGALASVLSLANVYFCFLPRGYFDTGSELNPVLHLWSLAVEEQFYVLWPWIVLLLCAARPRIAVALVVVLIVGCTVAGQLLLAPYPSAAYYLLPARAGELAVGGLLIFAETTLKPLTGNTVLATSAAVVGVALLVASSFGLTATSAFPGWNSLLPCAATALIIASGTQKRTLVARVLSLSPLTMLGVVSYSLYLYHWPVLAFLRVLQVDLSGIHGVSALLYIGVLTLLSYAFVEKPCRSVDWSPRNVFIVLFAVPAIVVAGLAGGLLLTFNRQPLANGATALTSPSNSSAARALVSTQRAICGYAPMTELVMRSCISGNVTKKPHVLVVGDSHAGIFYKMMGVLATAYNASVVGNMCFACPPLRGIKPAMLLPNVPCGYFQADFERVAALPQFRVVVLVAYWSSYVNAQGQSKRDVLSALSTYVKQLKAKGKQVLIIGDVPVFPHFTTQCKGIPFTRARDDARFKHCTAEIPYEDVGLNADLELVALEAGALYWSAAQLVCHETHCSPYDAVSGEPKYSDSNHLTHGWIESKIAELVKRRRVPRLFHYILSLR